MIFFGLSFGPLAPNPGRSFGPLAPNPGRSFGPLAPNPGRSFGPLAPNPGGKTCSPSYRATLSQTRLQLTETQSQLTAAQNQTKQALLPRIQLGLQLKFGNQGVEILPEISAIEDLNLLQMITSSLLTVESLEELRQIY